MDFQTILAIVIVGAVIFFIMKKRKDKKSEEPEAHQVAVAKVASVIIKTSNVNKN